MESPYAMVIVNPVAGASSTWRKWPLISRLLENTGLSFDYQCTEGVGHAIELAEAATNNGYSYIVAMGGDGTVNEVANGILRSEESVSTTMGMINTGTGSDFARSVGIPRNYASACSCLINSGKAKVDVGVVEFRKGGQHHQRFFINAAGVGFDAAVVRTTQQFPKYFGGTIPYLGGLARTLFGYKNKTAVIRVGEREVKRRIFSVVVANGRYFGGGMKVAPQAELRDSLLDVIIVGDLGKIELLQALPTVYRGTHLDHPKVEIERVSKVSVNCPEGVLVHADGELMGEGPACFWLKPLALNIMV